MEISVKELLEGKGTIIKGKEYFATVKYVTPFIEKMSAFTDDFKVFVKMPDQVTIGQTPDVTFNRVLIQAKLKNKIGDLTENVFMVYGLDVRKPVAKFYRGYTDEDGNLFVFNSEFQSIQAIEPEEPLIHNVKTLLEVTNDTETYVNLLNDTKLSVDPDNINKLVGEWVRKCMHFEHNSDFGKVKLSPNMAIDAYKLLFEDRSSKYFIPKEDKECDLFNVYQAFTKVIADDTKDLMNKFEKTLLIGNLLGIVK